MLTVDARVDVRITVSNLAIDLLTGMIFGVLSNIDVDVLLVMSDELKESCC